ncbi:glycoside hydrolase family 16 protein [Formosa sediminum]|uniref:Glycoside hydrolase family 16 protein n=1 Tax=Formosa sediminum TaxID=2594004 RepID=A0A516GVE9_9FLAO|nr:glycoside hydrolase family 16 protein [Formosa sediminum]QDO95504.1 glycoside hydrolase family 16 protein [Formosa sediminum]
MKNRIVIVLTVTLLSFLSCSSSDNDTNEPNTPTDLSISGEKFGADANNPNGDGSGVVDFTITATNATSYRVLINNETLELTNNTFSYTFTENGTQDYPVIVSAYNSAGFSSTTYSITVYVSNELQLVWSDEFDTNGTPNASNWGYDLSDGPWPDNNELQSYTNNEENVIVEDGMLKITAKADGTGYTSARLKSHNLQAFTYGKIEVRAKLPASQGTWPAIWMLGSNFSTVGWPNCGEMDIMEQTGWDKNSVLGTFHWQDSSSDTYAHYGESTSAPSSTSDFHLYTLEWTPETINVMYDDVTYVTLTNSSDLPFNADFFIILNVAMGGNLGGDVDPDFTQDTMEIDYVRVYQ